MTISQRPLGKVSSTNQCKLSVINQVLYSSPSVCLYWRVSEVEVCACVCRLSALEDNFVLAVNGEYVGREENLSLRLHEGSEVAIIPPLSGG